MKIILLTTETTHHQFFVWKLMERYPIHTVMVEDQSHAAPFPTHHEFEAQRDAFERDEFLKGCPCPLDDFTHTKHFGSMNDPESVAYLQQEKPDVILVFGTGKLKPAVFRQAQAAALNLHGGNPEEYRGLDTHLWAVYHRDFTNVVTTLHHLAPRLDTGDLVMDTQLRFPPNTELYQLRAINTQACVNLCESALMLLDQKGWLPGRQQQKLGRYYSFMPTELKEVCVNRFESYVKDLPSTQS